MGKKGDLSDFERGMVVGARWAGLVSGSFLGKNALLMPAVRGEWPDWFEMD